MLKNGQTYNRKIFKIRLPISQPCAWKGYKNFVHKEVILREINKRFSIYFHQLQANIFQMLTHWMPKLPLYKNQSIDSLYKSIDWFLYDANSGA